MNCNAVKVSEEILEKIDDRYDMSVSEMLALDKAYQDRIELLCGAFRFGYAQGQKAERARRKRGAAHE